MRAFSLTGPTDEAVIQRFVDTVKGIPLGELLFVHFRVSRWLHQGCQPRSVSLPRFISESMGGRELGEAAIDMLSLVPEELQRELIHGWGDEGGVGGFLGKIGVST